MGIFIYTISQYECHKLQTRTNIGHKNCITIE